MKNKALQKKFLSIGLIACSVLLAACSSNDSKGNESDKDSNEITLLSPDHSDVHPKNEDLWMWQEYEKKSGVKVKWEEMTDIDEKKNLILSRKTLPDALYQTGWSNDEITKYGAQGLFIPLEDLIPEHAPNLQKLMDENPVIQKALTSPDGHIYSLPYVCLDPMGGGRTFRMYINQNWLDTLDLEVPKTTEELENVLKEFVTKDPNGNGKADEQGWYMQSGELPNSFEKLIMAAYGLDTAGRKAIDNLLYLDDSGELQLTITDDKMKETWKYLKNLYDEGLISKQVFAGTDQDKWLADASKDQVGLFTWVGRDYIGSSVMDNYTPINVIEGPNGDKKLVVDPPVMGTSAFIITKDAANPEQLLEWVDYFYSEEGSEFGVFGKEGETYNLVDGEKVYTDDILNYEKGAQLGAYQKLDNVYAGFFPYLEPTEAEKQVAQGIEPEVYTDVDDDVMPEEILPEFTSTTEEAGQLSTVLTDMRNFLEQSRVKFINGEWYLDKDWDNYVEQLKKMGSDNYLKIRREQYERYKDA